MTPQIKRNPLERMPSLSAVNMSREEALAQRLYVKEQKRTFTDDQLMKYRKWFDAMDADKGGTVSIDELANVVLSSGIMKNKSEVKNMFNGADIDNSGEITFDEFLVAIAQNLSSRKLQLHKLDALVDSGSVLSTETVLTQQRRGVLMQHVVNNAAFRSFEIDRAWEAHELSRHRSRRSAGVVNYVKGRKRKNLDTLVVLHDQHMQKSKQTVMYLHQVIRNPQCISLSSSGSKDLSEHEAQDQEENPPARRPPLLVPLEDALPTSLLRTLDFDPQSISCSSSSSLSTFSTPSSSFSQNENEVDYTICPPSGLSLSPIDTNQRMLRHHHQQSQVGDISPAKYVLRKNESFKLEGNELHPAASTRTSMNKTFSRSTLRSSIALPSIARPQLASGLKRNHSYGRNRI